MKLLNDKVKSLLEVIQTEGNAYHMADGSVKPVFPTKDFSKIKAILSADDVKKHLMDELFGKKAPNKDDYRTMLMLMGIIHDLTDVKNKTAVQKRLGLTFANKVVALRKPQPPRVVKGKIKIKETKEKNPETGKPVGRDMTITPDKKK